MNIDHEDAEGLQNPENRLNLGPTRANSSIFCACQSSRTSSENYLLPPSLFPIGLAAGAIWAGFAISFTRGMGVMRACVAAAIYLAIQVAIGFTLVAAIG